MHILHYSLGFPPYRSGGLTKFCTDLMLIQKAQGHEVALLWPGTMLGSKPHIIKNKAVNGINSFELINPQPISYDEGIVEIDRFIKPVTDKVFLNFLKKFQPDVIHLHTFMGLPATFIEAAKALGIRVVFTTHDFFPICSKVTMYRDGQECDCIENCDLCPECNSRALSLFKIEALQSPIYRNLKDSKLVLKMRKNHRDNYFSDTIETIDTDRRPDDYLRLRDYYRKMFQKVDVIHYNSQIAKSAYDLYLGGTLHGSVIPISHSDINDCKTYKTFNHDFLRIRYLGPNNGAKGFFLLQNALDKLWLDQQNFVLDIHFKPERLSPYLRVHERYNYSELSKVFEETDLLVAPSIWRETFGFTVLEAISFGVPVLISGNVGAKDILVDGSGIVIDMINEEKLLKAISSLTMTDLKKMNQTIMEQQPIETIDSVSFRIMEECYL